MNRISRITHSSRRKKENRTKSNHESHPGHLHAAIAESLVIESYSLTPDNVKPIAPTINPPRLATRIPRITRIKRVPKDVVELRTEEQDQLRVDGGDEQQRESQLHSGILDIRLSDTEVRAPVEALPCLLHAQSPAMHGDNSDLRLVQQTDVHAREHRRERENHECNQGDAHGHHTGKLHYCGADAVGSVHVAAGAGMEGCELVQVVDAPEEEGKADRELFGEDDEARGRGDGVE